ncbi:MAG: ion transporter [Nautiliaceae bacterium]
MKEFLTQIVEYNDSTPSRVFNIFIQIVVIVSILNFSILTIPNLSSSTKQILDFIEITATIIFTVEYILRIYVAKNKLKYIFSFYGIIDLISILPFYLSLATDAQVLKILRIFRILRLFKLGRYHKSIIHFQKALKEAKEEFFLFLFFTLVLFYISAVGIYFFEHQAQPQNFPSVFASMWWAVATLTTVGYGDVYPITVGGKIFTAIILILGLGIVSVPAGIIASALTKANEERKKELEEEIKELKEKLSKYE